MDETNHDKFKERLAQSQRTTWIAAQILQERGLHVMVHPTFTAPTAAERHDFVDHGDMLICSRAEVKGTNYDWTSVEDWPFDDYIVTTTKVWDKANPKPAMVISLNKAETHFGIVRASLESQFYKKNFECGQYKDFTTENYCVPPALVEFAPISPKLLARIRGVR